MDENNIKKLDNVSGEYASKMMNYIKEILDWIYDQGKEITREVLECKLQEAYKRGKIDGYQEIVQNTLDNILYCTLNDIYVKQRKLYENNFYNMPSKDDVIQMRAYEYLTENLSKIIKAYQE